MTKLSREKQAAILSSLLTKDDLAAILKVKVRVLDNYMQAGLIPYVKFPNFVRFRREDVERAVDKLTIKCPKDWVARKARRGEVCAK